MTKCCRRHFRSLEPSSASRAASSSGAAKATEAKANLHLVKSERSRKHPFTQSTRHPQNHTKAIRVLGICMHIWASWNGLDPSSTVRCICLQVPQGTSPMPIPEQLRLLPPCHRSSWALGAWGLLLQIAKDHGDSSLIPKQCPEHMASLAGHCSCKLSKSQHSQAGAPITCFWQRPPLAAVAGSIIKRAWAISSCRRCVQSSNQQRTSRSHVCILRQPTKNTEATSNTSERRLHCSTA